MRGGGRGGGGRRARGAHGPVAARLRVHRRRQDLVPLPQAVLRQDADGGAPRAAPQLRLEAARCCVYY